MSLKPSRQIYCLLFLLTAIGSSAFAQSRVVISQVYGGGGNSGATYQNDFIELFNSGDTAVNLGALGWSVQYASATGITWAATNLTGTIQPGHYLLVQEGSNAAVGATLPAAEVTGTINLSATTGKVALVSSTTALTGTCPTISVVDLFGYGPTASCSESAPIAVLSNSTSAIRKGSGCTDNNTNNNDFAIATPSARNSATPAQACLALQSFGPVTSVSHNEGDSGTTTFAFTAKLNIPAPSTVTVNYNTADGTATAPSDYTAASGTLTFPTGQQTADITVQVNGDTTVEPDETFSVVLSGITGAFPINTTLSASGIILNDDAASVSLSFTPTSLPGAAEGVPYSQTLTVTNGTGCSFTTSGSVPPGLTLAATGTNTAALSGTPSFSGTFSFTASATCSNGSTSQPYSVTVTFACETGVKTSTAIHNIQGSGATSPLTGQTVEVEGIVVGDFQASTQLKGFYLQEPDATWDADPLTSEGIFIFDNLVGADVNVGDRVRIRGVVDEFSSSGSFLGNTLSSSLTEIGTIANKSVCSTGNAFTRTTVTLPIAAIGDLERYEGMAVQFTQQLTVTGNFSLGTFDQLDLAPSLLYVPTITPNQAAWPAQANLNTRSVIALDDASTLTNTNLYPTQFPQGGLSATNTLRDGALVNYDANAHTNTPLIGVLDDRFGEYRLQPTAAVTFYNANPRPAIAPILASTGGRFRAVSANVLNFFTTLGSRGAANQTEFDHQKTKVIEALSGMDGAVYGLSEVQNAANGNTGGAPYTNAALQSLVDGLNCKKAGQGPLCAAPPASPFALIDSLNLGASNGTDAIRTAIIYNFTLLTPVGSPAEYYQNDTNRPTLAQTFKPAFGVKADQQTFTFVVNHFRSKGSACGAGSDDIYQGNCNGLRLNMATNVTAWLAGNPTADPAGANRRLLLVGDFNAYYGEDPIQYFSTHGYNNLIAAIIGPSAYSYNFGSQAGYLDHAISNPGMNLLVKSVAEWHNNADEPSSLEALDSSLKSPAAQIAYYGADPYAASDHDPIVIGFNTLAGDLNDDGVVDNSDGALIRAAIGKDASAVDRRMDFDGDGKITLTDYNRWAALYRAYLQ